MHRVGFDQAEAYVTPDSYQIIAGGTFLSSTYRIDLDPFETREYCVTFATGCGNNIDINFRITTRDNEGLEVSVSGCREGSKEEVLHTAVELSKDEAFARVQTATRALKTGERHYLSQKSPDSCSGDGLLLYYERLSGYDIDQQFKGRLPQTGNTKSCIQNSAPVSAGTYGTICPSCGGPLEELSRHTTSDGMMGIDSDLWACGDVVNCRIVRYCHYEGYGHV